MHLHSQTCLVTGHFGLIPSIGIIGMCQLGLFHSPPWNLVVINSGNISPFFDTFLPFVSLFTDCLDVRWSISWESLSTLFPSNGVSKIISSSGFYGILVYFPDKIVTLCSYSEAIHYVFEGFYCLQLSASCFL